MVYQLPVTLNWTNRQKNIDGIEIWNQQLYVLKVKCAKAIPFPSHILDGVKMQSTSGSTYMDSNIPKLYLTKYCSPALLLMSEGLNYWYHQTVLPLFLVAQKEIRKDLVWDVTSEWVLILGRLSCEFFFFKCQHEGKITPGCCQSVWGDVSLFIRQLEDFPLIDSVSLCCWALGQIKYELCSVILNFTDLLMCVWFLQRFTATKVDKKSLLRRNISA